MEQSTPTLPLELVERIVDIAGQESTKTCMLVSRQFHAGALRNIYRNQSLDLRARPDVLLKKYSRLFGDEEDPCLFGGNRGRHVRKLSIQVGTWARPWGRRDPEYEEDIVLQLLGALSTRTGLRELHMDGGGLEYKWESLPLKIREGLQALLQSPILSNLSIHEVYGFPADILHGHKTLRVVKLNRCKNVNNASDHAVILPKATSLLSHYFGPVRNGLVLPRLQVLAAHHSTAEERQDSWVCIDRAREALTRISMLDNENSTRAISGRVMIMMPALPDNLKLSDFPELHYLDYVYEGGSWNRAGNAPLLCSIIPFFEVSVPVTQFSALRLQLSLDQSNDGLGEAFWMARKDLVATDRSWATLDTILASHRYPNLEEVCIDLKIFNWTLEELDSEIIRDVYPHYTGEKEEFARNIKNTVLGHLVRLKARGIDVTVEVSANF